MIFAFTCLLSCVCIEAFWITSAFDPAYGSWRLLYTDNDFVSTHANKCDLSIVPCIDMKCANVRISWMVEKYSIVVEKSSFSVVELIECKMIHSDDAMADRNLFLKPFFTRDHNIAKFNIVKSEKTVKSILFLGLPYVFRSYSSKLPSNLNILWKHNKDLGRLYISYGNYTYVFEKKCNDDTGPFSASQTSVIALNLLILSQILSTLVQKVIDQLEHF